MIGGVITIFCNVLCILSFGNFSTINWYDRAGNLRTIKLDIGAMFLLALGKIIGGGILYYKQGKLSKDLFAPILQEYRAAENGETNGIAMTVRKVPKMKEVKKIVKKITIATCFIAFLGMIITKDFLRDICHQVIKQEYEFMNKRNDTSL
jgi:hypothetical protein